ncbi:MAG TPA: hypothetical protein VK359_04605 [Rubrobacteraceae bacterium]|nr:hypothetical protein [Rubrobacteraceae bacterium]
MDSVLCGLEWALSPVDGLTPYQQGGLLTQPPQVVEVAAGGATK